MDVGAVLLETYGRIAPLARGAVEGLSGEQLLRRPTADANPIAWLVWHLARVQDHEISEVFDAEQLWVTEGWPSRFGREADPDDTGYGHSSADVAAVRPERPEVLLEYLDAVEARTRAWLATVTPQGLDQIVDERWDPPVTLGARLVSVADDCLQHLGQAAYVRGMLV